MDDAALWVLGCGAEGGLATFNATPTAEITAPIDVVMEGPVVLRGRVSDTDDAGMNLRVAWYIGSEAACAEAAPDASGESLCTVFLDHDTDVTITVRDPGNASASDARSVVVTPNSPPIAMLTDPTEAHTVDETIVFTGWVSDQEDRAEDLLTRWTSDLDPEWSLEATPDASGAVLAFGELIAGVHPIRMEAVDLNGKSGWDSVVIEVRAKDQPPECRILSPDEGAVVRPTDVLTLAAEASDADGSAAELTVKWSDNGVFHVGRGGVGVPQRSDRRRASDLSGRRGDRSRWPRGVTVYTLDGELRGGLGGDVVF